MHFLSLLGSCRYNFVDCIVINCTFNKFRLFLLVSVWEFLKCECIS